ncbi:MAG TPA: tetratricopeptide repeat protein, partial [Pirellulales bacterium]|nr:tetratricopeptide repeat protein [Pirellulales bacterium]
MVGLFYLLTLYGALRYWTAGDEPARVGWLLFATTACLAGMASKEVMVTAPVVVLLFERAFVAGSLRQALRQSWPLYVGLALGWTLLFALNQSGPRSGTAGFRLGVSPLAYWCTESKALLLYLKLVVWPWPLVIHYDMPYLDTFAAAWPWVLPALLLAMASLYLLWRNTIAGFVAAAIWLILSPTLVVPIITEVAVERRMYLPLAALCALAVAGGYFVLGKMWPRNIASTDGLSGPRAGALAAATIAVVAVAGAYGMLDARRMVAYESPLGLWQDALRNQPHNPVILASYGTFLIHAGRAEEAVGALAEAAKSPRPEVANAMLHMNLGTALALSGRVDESIPAFREAIRLQYDHPEDVYRNLGILLVKAGRAEEGLRELEESLRLQPDSPPTFDYMGLALIELNRPREAVARLKHAVRLAPDVPKLHYHLGRALAADQQPRQAVSEFEMTLRLQPDYREATRELGRALVESQQPTAAIGPLQKAVKAEPEDAALHYDLGRALAGAGRPREAIAEFQLAAKHGQRSSSLYRSYGQALLQLGRASEAAAQFDLASAQEPDDAETHFAAAKAHAQSFDANKAIASAESALRIAQEKGLSALAAEIESWLADFRKRQAGR